MLLSSYSCLVSKYLIFPSGTMYCFILSLHILTNSLQYSSSDTPYLGKTFINVSSSAPNSLNKESGKMEFSLTWPASLTYLPFLSPNAWRRLPAPFLTFIRLSSFRQRKCSVLPMAVPLHDSC